VRRARFAVQDGPVRLGVILHPAAACVVWFWYGRRYNVGVKRVDAPSGGKLWLCPRCARRVAVLLVAPPDRIGCRHCLAVRYAAWQRNGRYRQPKRPDAWLKWLARRAGKAGVQPEGRR